MIKCVVHDSMYLSSHVYANVSVRIRPDSNLTAAVCSISSLFRLLFRTSCWYHAIVTVIFQFKVHSAAQGQSSGLVWGCRPKSTTHNRAEILRRIDTVILECTSFFPALKRYSFIPKVFSRSLKQLFAMRINAFFENRFLLYASVENALHALSGRILSVPKSYACS